MIGLKFVLHGGAFLAVVIPKEKALQLVKDWSSGLFTIKNIPYIFSETSNEESWAVRVDQIQALHTFKPENATPHVSGQEWWKVK